MVYAFLLSKNAKITQTKCQVYSIICNGGWNCEKQWALVAGSGYS